MLHFGIYTKYSLYELYHCKTFARENEIHRVKTISDPDPNPDPDPDPYQNEMDPQHCFLFFHLVASYLCTYEAPKLGN